MTSLLKANFYKLFKDKITYVLIAITVLIALFTIAMYSYMIDFLPDIGAVEGSFRFLLSAQSLFLSSAVISQNIGLVIAIAVALYVGREFSQNTIRNKIIVGHNKTKVYLSNLIVSVVLGLMIYVAFVLIVFGIGLPVLGWGGAFVVGDFVKQLVNSLLIIITFSAVLNMIAMLSRNLVIGLTISVILLIIGSSVLGLLSSLPFTGMTKDIINFVIKSNFLGQSLLISSDNSLTFLLWVVASSAVFITGSAIIGSWLFEKCDVK